MATSRNVPRSLAKVGPPAEITSRILRIVSRKRKCHMEDLLQSCDAYTWNQVFLEVDRLSRTGELRLVYQQDGDYAVTLPLAS
jgi:hypothetical protein